jgi:hypothetical protein
MIREESLSKYRDKNRREKSRYVEEQKTREKEIEVKNGNRVKGKNISVRERMCR